MALDYRHNKVIIIIIIINETIIIIIITLYLISSVLFGLVNNYNVTVKYIYGIKLMLLFLKIKKIYFNIIIIIIIIIS